MITHLKIAALAVLIFGAVSGEAAPAVYWRALGLLESAENDRAVGRSGEVSRYQILPRVWRGTTSRRDWQSEPAARAVAARIQAARCATFRSRFGRDPSPSEWYVLWNAPSQILKPSPVVAERAQRFSNLVAASLKTR